MSDFGTWTSWSPWLCAEPDAKVTVTQDSSSVGSIYAWEGEVVGIGEIEHRHLEPGRLIEEEIRFVKTVEVEVRREVRNRTGRQRGNHHLAHERFATVVHVLDEADDGDFHRHGLRTWSANAQGAD